MRLGCFFLENCLFVCDFLRSSLITFRGIVSTWRICIGNTQWSKVVLKVNVLVESSFLFGLMTITDWFLVSCFIKLHFFITSRYYSHFIETKRDYCFSESDILGIHFSDSKRVFRSHLFFWFVTHHFLINKQCLFQHFYLFGLPGSFSFSVCYFFEWQMHSLFLWSFDFVFVLMVILWHFLQ